MKRRTAAASLTSVLIALALASACTSQEAGVGVGKDVTGSTAASTANRGTSSSASPAAGAAALGKILEGVALKSADLAGGDTVTLVPQGDQVTGQVTLDNCGYDFTTEADRLARRQYAVLTSTGEETGVVNELVAYDSATDASEAMSQWLQSVLTCPTTPVKSNVAGVPDLTMKVILNEYQNASPLPNRVNDLTVESGTAQGETEYLIAVQQIHGRYLDSVYEQLPTMPDNATINAAVQLATITGARLAAQN